MLLLADGRFYESWGVAVSVIERAIRLFDGGGYPAHSHVCSRLCGRSMTGFSPR